jgi:putative membrane protein insertion efficiency factor
LRSAVRALRPALPAVRPRAFDALSVPAFRIYAAAQVLVGSGTWIQNITQDWLVLTLTHDAGAVGLTAAFQFLPALLLGPLGGRLADRLPGRRLLGRTQALNVVVAGATAVLALSGGARPWEIYLLAVLAGLVWVVDNPARQALVSDLVGSSALRSAVALNGAIFQSARIVAPALAGVLITTAGPGTAFCVDTAFFAAGLLMWSRLRTPVGVRSSSRAAQSQGSVFGYLRRRPRTAVAILLVGVVGTFGLNFPVVLTVIAADDFHGSANLYGAFNIALAVGSIGGALVAAGWRGSRLRRIILLGGAFGAAQAVTALAGDRMAFLGLLTTVGFSNMAFQTVANSAVQLWTAPEMRGQVLGVYGQVFVGGTPIGAPIVGAFTDHAGGRAGMAACGIVPLGVAILLAVVLAARSSHPPVAEAIPLVGVGRLVPGKGPVMAWRRRYPPYDPRYDPRYDPYGRPGWGPRPGYGYRPGGSCLRDACLLETGCCLAESLDGNCLVAAVVLLPQLARALSSAPPRSSSGGRYRSGTAARAVAAVRVYQREISAGRRPVCRFTPSCSEYAAQAMERHGALRGSMLAAGRLLRCRPGGSGGADPVPL